MDIPVHPDQQARIDQFLETQKEENDDKMQE